MIEELQKYIPPLRIKNEGLSALNECSTRKYNICSQYWLWFHLQFFMTTYDKLQQSFSYKMREKFITKCLRLSLF